MCVWDAWVLWLTTRDKCGDFVLEEIVRGVCTTRRLTPPTRHLHIYMGV